MRLIDDRRLLFAVSLALHLGFGGLFLLQTGSTGMRPGPPVQTEIQMEAIGVGGGGAAVPSDESEATPQGTPDATSATAAPPDTLEAVTETSPVETRPAEEVTTAREDTALTETAPEPVTTTATERVAAAEPPLEVRSEPPPEVRSEPPPLQSAEAAPAEEVTASRPDEAPRAEPRETVTANDFPEVMTTTGLSEPPIEAIAQPEPARAAPQPEPQPRVAQTPPQPRREPVRRPPEPVRETRAERIERAERARRAVEARRQVEAQRAAREAQRARAQAAAQRRGTPEGRGRPGGVTGTPGGSTGGGQTTADYLALVRAELMRRRVYPPDALARGEQGVVTVRLTIIGSGRVGGHSILRGSGSRSIDASVAQMMSRISLPAPPNGSLTVTVPIRFSIN
jgi:protein TonB